MLDVDTARRLGAEIVAKVGPDFRYRRSGAEGRCYYKPLPEVRADGKEVPAPIEGDVREITGCLVGRILDAAGETRHRLPLVGAMDGVEELREMFPGMFGNRTVMYLNGVQSAQDAGHTWKVALERGEHYLRNS